MADAAARREARRRRILENAEYRMQRITGGWTSDTNKSNDINKDTQVNHIETDECEKIKKSENESTLTSTNGILANESLGHQTIDSLINEMNADINNDETNSSPYADMFDDILNTLSKTNDRDRETFYEPRRRNAVRNNVPTENGNATGTIKIKASNNVGLNSERQDALAGTQIDTGRDNSISNSKAEISMFNRLLSSRLIYVILAIVINIFVALRMEHLFGTSIVIPFIIVMIGRLCVRNTYDESRGSNMLVAALILSNVRPDFVKLIHRLKNALSLFRVVLQDFAVYIFTFVIMYTIIYRYWIDLDILPEVMLNEKKSM